MTIKSPDWQEDPVLFATLAARWSTAAFGCAADTTPMERSVLGEHLRLCLGSRGRLFGMRCLTDAVKGYLAAHVVTSVLTGGMLVVLGWLVI